MLDRRLATLIVLVWLFVPAGVFGQAVEEAETETVKSPAFKLPTGAEPDLSQVEKLIIQKTNAFRKEQGGPAVEVNPRLTETARYFAGYMAKTNKYGHTADGSRPADRAKKFGYDYCLVAENIAYQYSSAGFATEELARRFFEGWKESPGHRKNMLDPDVTETAVALAQSADTGYFYAVQMFGRPKSAAIEFAFANEADAAVEYRIGERTFPLPPRVTRTHTRCRPSEATFQLPDGKPDSKGETKTIRPGDGDRYVVVREKGSYQVKKE